MADNPLDRLINLRTGGDEVSLPCDDVSRELLPTIWAFLTRRFVSEDLEKERASVSIRLGVGMWIVELSDPSLEVGLTAAVPSLHDALEALEARANDPQAAWKPWRGSEGKFRRRNKRSDAT